MHEKRGRHLVGLGRFRFLGRLGKKAQESLMWTVIFELILVGAAFLLLTVMVADLAGNTLIYKQYHAGEMGMLTSALYAAPGDVSYRYNLDDFSSKNFYFEISDSKVYVGDAKRGVMKDVVPEETLSQGNAGGEGLETLTGGTS